MAERTTTGRVRGTLFIDPQFMSVIRDHELGRVATIMQGADTEANAAHLVACWNAVEAAGGDPAIVAEALDVLTTLQGLCDQNYKAVDVARDVLRKAGRLNDHATRPDGGTCQSCNQCDDWP